MGGDGPVGEERDEASLAQGRTEDEGRPQGDATPGERRRPEAAPIVAGEARHDGDAQGRRVRVAADPLEVPDRSPAQPGEVQAGVLSEILRMRGTPCRAR